MEKNLPSGTHGLSLGLEGRGNEGAWVGVENGSSFEGLSHGCSLVTKLKEDIASWALTWCPLGRRLINLHETSLFSSV